MAHRFRKLVARLRAAAPVRFGTRRPLGRPCAPADRFTRFGDGRRVLVANGATLDPDPVDVLRAEMGLLEPHDASPYAGMTETERRAVDPDNEITGEPLDALVASLLAAYPEERLDALTAATNPDGTVTAASFHAYLCAEGIRTDDGRELALGACRYPDLPVSIRLLVEDEGGHWGAVTCGRIDSMDRRENQPQDGINLIYATGVFGTDPNGQLAELMVEEQTQRFVSIDPRDVTGEMISVRVTRESYDVIIIDEDDDEGVVEDCWFRMTDLVIGAATIVPMPAIQNAVITLASVALPDSPIATSSAPQSVVVASSAPLAPPRDWFDDPGFGGGSRTAFDAGGDPRLVLQEDGRSYACPWTIDDHGRVYGHVAWWAAEHTGFAGQKVHPPRSRSSYAYYLTGPGVMCADGTLIEGVAQITAGCGHASTSLAWKAAAAHYDGGAGAFQVADVRAGEDEYGIWVSGALRSDLTPEQLRQARALAPSGDWRDIGGSLEMVATLLVPVPGFPIRRAVVASAGRNLDEFGAVRMGVDGQERVLSLVAAGRVRRVDPVERIANLERHVARLEAEIRPLAVDSARRLLA